MQFDITKRCADSLRLFLQNTYGILIKSSHAHELVSSYFGYSSRAALLADIKFPIVNLRQAEIIVLTPTAEIKKRRKELKELPENMPDDIAEGVYLPLYEEKWIINNIWPTFEYLGIALADDEMKLKSFLIKEQKILREEVKTEFIEDGVRITVSREYISPNLLLSSENGTRGICLIFELKRVAGYIGYIKTSHYWTEAESLDAAKEKLKDREHSSIKHLPNHEANKYSVVELNFPDWLARLKNRNSPLGDLARKRGFSNQNDEWPSYDNLEAYIDHLKLGNPPLGTTAAMVNAWKAYKLYLKKKASPSVNIKNVKIAVKQTNNNPKIVYVKNVIPIHFTKRSVETFNPGDLAWISFDGRKAIPVTILEVDDRHYTFRVERPLNKAGEIHYLFLDEVRSTPELACANHA